MIEVVSHRGAAGLEPENTLAGFRRAVQLGADRTECDVRLTRDERLIVIHDDTVDRTTDGTGAVSELTFEQVRALDAGNGQRVPTLEEILEAVRDSIVLELELKGEGTEEQAVATVRELEMREQVVFVSFVPDRLRTVRRTDPSLEVAPIFARPPEDACRRAAEIDASGVRILYRNLTWGLVREAHELGLEVGAWSPNEEAEWRAMTALGVDVICTDQPDRLIAMLGREG